VISKRRNSRRRSAEERLLAQVARNFAHSPTVLGDRSVHCYVSDRWLAFPPTSAAMKDGADLLVIGVMTRSAEGDVSKICDVILDRAHVLRALAAVKQEPFGR